MKNIILLLSILCLSSACSIVGPGQRGVRVSLGTASDDVKPSGAYLWIPFVMGMKKIDVQVQKSEDQTSAASKDMQEITASIAINWQIDPSKVVITYKQIGDEDEVFQRVIAPAVSEVLKSAASKRTAEEILTKRMELKSDIDDGLKARLNSYGVLLMDVSILNLSFSKEFTTAIEEKQIAEQQAKQAEYVASKAIQEAKAEVNRAKGQAEAQQLLRLNLTKEILEQKAIEKWNGVLPVYMTQGQTPFIQLNRQ